MNAFVRLIIFVILFTYVFPVTAMSASISTNAAAVTLLDATSGRILYERKGNEQMRIASLTKIMTAIVAIEHGNVTDWVTISANAYGKEGSSLYLAKDEKMKLLHLLYGLMLRSGNDAAVAIAEHVGGSLEGFVYLMNEKARIIGMSGSHFMNPHGLDDSDQHYSTAIDLAKLTRYAMNNRLFKQIVQTKLKRVKNPNQPWDYKWYNKNKLLSLYPGADGVKTGFTKLAKRCLVSSATRNGQQLIVVTLNDSTDWVDHMRLYEFGFEQYPLTMIAEKGRRSYDGSRTYFESLPFPLQTAERSKLKQTIDLERNLAYFHLHEKQIAQVKLVPLTDEQPPQRAAQNKSWMERLLSFVQSLF
jgi:D-alanyl-D-alanine carboxypeptidase